jgi:hypothetical protein
MSNPQSEAPAAGRVGFSVLSSSLKRNVGVSFCHSRANGIGFFPAKAGNSIKDYGFRFTGMKASLTLLLCDFPKS